MPRQSAGFGFYGFTNRHPFLTAWFESTSAVRQFLESRNRAGNDTEFFNVFLQAGDRLQQSPCIGMMRVFEQIRDGGRQDVFVHTRLVTDDAWPAQKVHGVRRSYFRRIPADLLDHGHQLFQHRPVELDGGFAGEALHAQAAVELAALQVLAQRFPQRVLHGSELIGQPELNLQEPVIDRPDLPGEDIPGGMGLGPGESRHAIDHGVKDMGEERASLYPFE